LLSALKNTITMSDHTPASAALTAHGIPHRTFTHASPVRSIEQAAAERGQQVEQVIRSILFRLSEGEYAMVLIAGKSQISWKALRKHFGTSRLTMASAEEVLAATGYQIGTVSPFGIAQPIPVLADRSVFTFPEVSLGSGSQSIAIIMQTEDLKQALGDVEIGEFAAG
jgi:Cys-tRNA(Pro) deacylase